MEIQVWQIPLKGDEVELWALTESPDARIWARSSNLLGETMPVSACCCDVRRGLNQIYRTIEFVGPSGEVWAEYPLSVVAKYGVLAEAETTTDPAPMPCRKREYAGKHGKLHPFSTGRRGAP